MKEIIKNREMEYDCTGLSWKIYFDLNMECDMYNNQGAGCGASDWKVYRVKMLPERYFRLKCNRCGRQTQVEVLVRDKVSQKPF